MHHLFAENRAITPKRTEMKEATMQTTHPDLHTKAPSHRAALRPAEPNFPALIKKKSEAKNPRPLSLETHPPNPVHTTLFALVESLNEVTENEAEIIATVDHLLRTNKVRLQEATQSLHLSTPAC